MDETCSVEGCEVKAKTRGWCHNHYMGFYMHGACPVDGCSRPARSKDAVCRSHWPTECVIKGCDREPGEDGQCRYHRRRFGDPNRICKICGKHFTGDKRSSYCSRECRDNNRRSPLRIAVLSGDRDAIVAAAQQGSSLTRSGCWEWRGVRNDAGYPVGGGARGLVHRTVFAASFGDPGHRPVHHKCANRSCVNPDHLQLTTHHDNCAEMFSRSALKKRIADLEAALRESNPLHPLLEGDPPP